MSTAVFEDVASYYRRRHFMHMASRELNRLQSRAVPLILASGHHHVRALRHYPDAARGGLLRLEAVVLVFSQNHVSTESLLHPHHVRVST